MDIEFTAGVSGFDGTGFNLTQNRLQETAQRLSIRFRTYLGSWFLDTGYGVDWFNQVLGKGRTKLAVDTLIQLEIKKDKYVDQIVSFTSKIDKNVYSCKFRLKVKSVEQTAELKLLATENGLSLSDQFGNSFSITT